jgi:eukaryotic-like serine/threonine-protein kinase
MRSVEASMVRGAALDRYTLVAPIGAGGMGVVWLAEEQLGLGLRRFVAVKTVGNPEGGELAQELQAMLLEEARIASRVEHPNVARILSVGRSPLGVYLVLEWVDGEPLSRIMQAYARRSEPFPPELALRIVADACRGLHVVHELTDLQGQSLDVVHRDISPQNLMVSTTGTVKIIDFGIAKARGRLIETTANAVKGKVRFMSPEQAMGERVDRRTDVWAFGVTLYLMFEGRYPIDGANDLDVLRKLILMGSDLPFEAPLPMSKAPPAVAAIVDRCLLADCEARYPTTEALQHAIEEALDHLHYSVTNRHLADALGPSLTELGAARRAEVLHLAEDTRTSKQNEAAGANASTPQPAIDPAEEVAPRQLSGAQSHGWLIRRWFALPASVVVVGLAALVFQFQRDRSKSVVAPEPVLPLLTASNTTSTPSGLSLVPLPVASLPSASGTEKRTHPGAKPVSSTVASGSKSASKKPLAMDLE